MRQTVPVLLLGAIATLAGCEQTMRNMYDQSRYKPLAASALWPDGRASRPPPDGAVPRSAGTFADSTSGRLGPSAPAPALDPLLALRDELRPGGKAAAPESLPPPTAATFARGRERFEIFCSPCHSVVGDGDGMVARRGFPHPPSFHTDRLRQASDAHFYAVITEGYGAMHSYALRIEPADRIAIVGYIRALQLAQHAPVAALTDAERARLAATTEKPR
jgi:hypothetical protein